MTAFRIVGTENAIAVKLPRSHIGQENVPDLIGVLGHRDANVFLARIGRIEKTEINRRGAFGEEGEIDAVLHPGGAERIGIAEPNFYGSHR